MSDSLVIIPTYNEKENIANIIKAVFSLDVPFHVLIVDDGSPDGTAKIVKALQQEYPNELFLIERQGKLGLGTAYIRGFKFGIEKKYDFICSWPLTTQGSSSSKGSGRTSRRRRPVGTASATTRLGISCAMR